MPCVLRSQSPLQHCKKRQQKSLTTLEQSQYKIPGRTSFETVSVLHCLPLTLCAKKRGSCLTSRVRAILRGYSGKMSSSKPKRSKKRSREDEESARRKSVTFAEEISARYASMISICNFRIMYCPFCSQGQSAGANSVVRGDADSTVGSRTTITLSSGKWAVVKPSSGAVTASLAKKRLVLFQLPSDVRAILRTETILVNTILYTG